MRRLRASIEPAVVPAVSGLVGSLALRLGGFVLYLGRSYRPGSLLLEETRADSFTAFVTETETRLRHALTAAFDAERGREATAEALAYGWEHWDRVREMDNPSGYLYRVGRDRARRMTARRPAALPPLAGVSAERWVEPGLQAALARLPERQRLVVALLYGYQWSMSEVAGLLGVSKGTVQSYSDRALKRLRRRLGVEL